MPYSTGCSITPSPFASTARRCEAQSLNRPPQRCQVGRLGERIAGNDVLERARARPPRLNRGATAEPNHELTLDAPFAVPVYWMSAQALAVYELLDELRALIWVHYETELLDELREIQTPSGSDPSNAPDDDPPF
jgi:hypothetical protein